MCNKKLLEMCDEVSVLVDQLNNLSYNYKDDRQAIDEKLNKFDLIYDAANGDVLANTHLKSMTKEYIQ
jgi:hypothetical protein